MNDDPLKIFRVLQQHGVPFVIIGGHAVALHGFPRATEDADIVFLRTPDSEQRLTNALEELKAFWISNEKDPATGLERQIPVTHKYVQSSPIMWLTTDLGFLDILDHVPGFPSANPRELMASSVSVDGLHYVSKKWLVRMKKAADRPQDRVDVNKLEDQ